MRFSHTVFALPFALAAMLYFAKDFRRMIRSIGRVPAERTTTYKIRHLYNDDEEPGAPAQPQLNLLQSATHVSYAEGAY